MSASRRAEARKTRAGKPYDTNGRTHKFRGSGWIGSLLGFFAGSQSPEPEPTKNPATSSDIEHTPPATPAEALTERGRQIIHDLSTDEDNNDLAGLSTPTHAQPAYASAPPVTPVTNYSPSITRPSPSDHIDRVTAFLHGKKGQTINEWEAEGIIAYLQKAKQNDRSESFRFSTSPTPARGNSPVKDSPSQPQSSPRMLSRNPNGPYRFEGLGSARPRNRYHSPNFGSPRATTTTIKLPAPEMQKSDTKRRRVGEEASISSVQPASTMATPPRAAAPPPSPNRPSDTSSFPFPVSNVASPSVNGTPSEPQVKNSRSRVSAFVQSQKPTVPANPSPLRQTWSQTDSPSSSSSSPPSTSKPTNAANFMTELIKEVTPAKKNDAFLNPYQTASPVKITAKASKKRTRAAAKPAPKKEKPAEPSPQAIIEATVPKGSKRSRPPSNMTQSTRGEGSYSSSIPSEPPRRSPRTQPSQLPSTNGINGKSHASKPASMIVEEISDDEDNGPASKKQKHSPAPVNGAASKPVKPASRHSVTVEEVEDEDRPSHLKPQHAYIRPSEVIEPSENGSASNPVASSPVPTKSASPPPQPRAATTNSKTSGLKAIPKEPSKLRFSYRPDVSPGSTSTTTNSTPSAFAPQPESPTSENHRHVEPKPKLDPKAAALEADIVSLPAFTFPLKESSNDQQHLKSVMPQGKANATPISALPAFDFTVKDAPPTSHVSPPPAPVSTFNWAAAGIKPASKNGVQDWTCSTCMCLSPQSATKCVVCETPR